MNIEENLKNHQIELEDASKPAGNYVPYIITNKLVFISGQLPFKQGKIPITGVVGETVSSCLLYTSPSPRDRQKSRMPSSA